MEAFDHTIFAKNWNVPIFDRRTFDPATIGVGVTTPPGLSGLIFNSRSEQ